MSDMATNQHDGGDEQISRAEQIARLNDIARTAMGIASLVVQTPGIKALPEDVQSRSREKVELFDDFDEDNDPYGERDLGVFEHGGHRVMWKIDYYNLTLDGHSEDKANPKVTKRVLTIMLASEY